MTDVKTLFEMSDWALVEAWRKARLEEINAPPYSAEGSVADALARARAQRERKLAVQVIRLAIRFRLAAQDCARGGEPNRVRDASGRVWSRPE